MCSRIVVTGAELMPFFEGKHLFKCGFDLNTTRVSNFFCRNKGGFLFGKPCGIRLSVFLCTANTYRKRQNCEDAFKLQHRDMNTAFRYSYFDMLLQTLAVSCISAFDGGGPHYKNGYTHPRSSENAVQKCIHAGRSPLF